MKKMFSLLLVIVMLLGLSAGCSNTGGETTSAPSTTGNTEPSVTNDVPKDHYTIAVGMTVVDQTMEVVKRYLNEEIAPAYNVDFIFSEKLVSTEDLLTFMENSYSAGADAVFSTITNAQEASVAKGEELGMYVATMASKDAPVVAASPYNLGIVGISGPIQGDIFGEVAQNVLNDGKEHNIIIVSGGASMGVTSHLETTISILEMLQSKYNLTYDKPIPELAELSAQTEISTGSDMKVVIYPGFVNLPTFVPDFSTLLQTGKYDVVLSTFASFTTLGVAIEEVEKAFSMDVEMIAVTSINEASATAFTADATGKTALTAAVVNPQSIAFGMGFAMLYNAMTGNRDAICTDGNALKLGITPWAINGPDDYFKLANLDTNHDTYCLNSDDIRKLLYIYNPDVNGGLLQETLNSMTAENLLASKIK